MKVIKKIFQLAFILFLTTGCQNSVESISDNNRVEILLTRSEAEIVSNQNKFAFKFYNTIPKNDQNVVISPLSASIDLSMLANIATESYRREIVELLSPENDLSKLNEFNKRIVESIKDADKTTEIRIDNAIWFPNNAWTSALEEVNNSFATNCTQYYNATISRTEENTTFDPNAIADWVNNSTKGLVNIPSDEIESYKMAKFIILNTLYFQGQWMSKFNESKTTSASFTNSDGTISEVRMMSQKDATASAYADEKFSTLRMKFGNGAFTIYFILPNDKTVGEIASLLSSEVWENTKANLIGYGVNISLPKFELSNSINLGEHMDKLGLKCFSNIASDEMDELFAGIDLKFNQNIFFKIDESGAEIAAQTNVKGMESSVGPLDKFTIDHPFLFIIEESSTGAIMFMGEVNKM